MDWSKISGTELYLAAMQVSFECETCCKCCKEMVGIAYNSVDCQRMAKYLGIGVHEFMKEYTVASPRKPGDRWFKTKEPNRSCQFLGDYGCTVYEGRGQVCRAYPWFTADAVTAVRNKKPYKIFPACKGMVLSLWRTIQIAKSMSLKEAQEILKSDVGRLCWIWMVYGEGKLGTVDKICKEMGYANLPPRENLAFPARLWAAAILVIEGPRKLDNMEHEVEKYVLCHST